MPHGADFYDTSEYLLGTVAVAVAYLESNGVIDPDTESWTDEEEDTVLLEVVGGCDFWANKTDFPLSFVYETYDSVMVDYEPINRELWEDYLYIPDALGFLGYPGVDYFYHCREFINDLRTTYQTDWAFVTFQVDASNDPDGAFPGGWGGWSYFGGPYNIVAWDDNEGAIPHDQLCAHEFAHNFYALDEYSSAQVPCDARSGYLNWDNQNSVYPPGECTWDALCTMRNAATWFVCRYTKRHMGWQDGDGDDIPLILDTNPETSLNPPFIEGVIATYTGDATVVPHPNLNPMGQGHDITLNTIAAVEYRVSLGPWTPAAPSDGSWDSGVEEFEFTTPPLPPGIHLVEARAVNSVGNADTTYASDSLSIDATGVMITLGPETRFLVTAAPNPFTSSLVITCEVPRSEVPVTLKIHDVQGRLMWSRDHFAEGSGVHRILWDGSDSSGRALRSGIYFVSAEALGQRSVQRVAMVR
jgi:hypothetical protein